MLKWFNKKIFFIGYLCGLSITFIFFLTDFLPRDHFINKMLEPIGFILEILLWPFMLPTIYVIGFLGKSSWHTYILGCYVVSIVFIPLITGIIINFVSFCIKSIKKNN